MVNELSLTVIQQGEVLGTLHKIADNVTIKKNASLAGSSIVGWTAPL